MRPMVFVVRSEVKKAVVRPRIRTPAEPVARRLLRSTLDRGVHVSGLEHLIWIRAARSDR